MVLEDMAVLVCAQTGLSYDRISGYMDKLSDEDKESAVRLMPSRTVSMFILYAFAWEDTIEGSSFWVRFADLWEGVPIKKIYHNG